MDTWVGGRRLAGDAVSPGPSRPRPTRTPLAGFLAGAQLGAGSGAPRPQSAALHPRHCGRHGRPSGHGSALRHAGAEADSGSSLLRACLGSR